MAEREQPKLEKRPSKTRLHKSASRFSIELPKTHHLQENEEHQEDKRRAVTRSTEKHNDIEETQKHNDGDKNNDNHDKVKEKDTRKGRKGKRKEKGRGLKFDEGKDAQTKKSVVSQADGTVIKREYYGSYVLDKVKEAIGIVCKDGATRVNVDNVTALMKSLDISTNEEWFMDLIRNAIIDNYGEIVPLELDALVMKAQEENQLTNVDECLDAAFNLIDCDNDGIITQMDIRTLMLRLGENPGDYAVDDMLLAADGDKDGNINLRDFRSFLLGRDDTRPLSGQANNVKIRTQREINNQESDNELTQNFTTKAESSIDEDKFKKLRSVFKGVKLVPKSDVSEMLSLGKHKDLKRTGNLSGSSLAQTNLEDGLFNEETGSITNRDESINSPRRLESARLKKLFFGGFIDKFVTPTNNTSNDTENDTSSDIQKDTSNDIQKDTSNDTQKDTFIDIQKDTSNDTQKDTSNDTQKDTSNDTQKDTPNDTQKDTSNETQKDTSIDTQKDTSNDTQKDTSIDTQNDTFNDTQKDTFNDTQNDTFNDIQKDTSNDTQKDTSNDTQSDEAKGPEANLKSRVLSEDSAIGCDSNAIGCDINAIGCDSNAIECETSAIECDNNEDIILPQRNQTRVVNGENRTIDVGTPLNESLKRFIGGVDVEKSPLDNALEQGPVPSQTENRKQNSLPVDASVDDVSYLEWKSASQFPARRQSVIVGNSQPVSVSMTDAVSFSPGRVDTSSQTGVEPNSSPVDRQRSLPSSYHNKDDSAEKTDGFSNTIVINLRPRRSSSISSTAQVNNENKHSDEQREAAHNLDKVDNNEGVDSDEGIDVDDEKVTQRSLHIPLSPKASSTSLRIYLPSGDVLSRSDVWERDVSCSKPRSRITIDLQNFSVDDEDDESVEQDKDDDNDRKHAFIESSNIDSFSNTSKLNTTEAPTNTSKLTTTGAPTNTSKLTTTREPTNTSKLTTTRERTSISKLATTGELTNINNTHKPHGFSDCSSDNDLDDYGNHELTQREMPYLPSNETLPSVHGIKPLSKSEDSTASQSTDYIHQYYHTIERRHERNHHNNESVAFNFPKPPDSYPHTTPSSARAVHRTSRMTKPRSGYSSKHTRVEQRPSLSAQQLMDRQTTTSLSAQQLMDRQTATSLSAQQLMDRQTTTSLSAQQLMDRQTATLPHNVSTYCIPDRERKDIPLNYSSSPSRTTQKVSVDQASSPSRTTQKVSVDQASSPSRTTQKVSVNQASYELRFEKPKPPQLTTLTLKSREAIKQKKHDVYHNRLSRDQETDYVPFDNYYASKVKLESDKQRCEKGMPTNEVKVDHRKLKRSKTSIELPVVRETLNESQTQIASAEKSPLKKRSFSATTNRNTRSAPSVKPEYKSLSVLNLSNTIQIEKPFGKNIAVQQRHYTVSNIVPLSRVINGYDTRRSGFNNKVYYSVSRQVDKSGVPYFLHDAPRIKTCAWDTERQQEKITRKKGHKKKASKLNKADDLDPFSTSHDNEVSTLVGEFKDDDLIPNEVIFSTIRQFKDELFKK